MPFIASNCRSVWGAGESHPKRHGFGQFTALATVVLANGCTLLKQFVQVILSTVSKQADENQKVVEFNNRKRRGNNVLNASYSYALERSISYEALLLSVQPVDHDAVVSLKEKAELAGDAEVVQVVKACISNGITSKMNLAIEVAKRAGFSRRIALNIIEKYTGSELGKHHWNFAVRERGAKVYSLLEPV